MENSQVPTTGVVNSLEWENETPTESRPSQFPITNGLLRRYQPLHRQPSLAPESADSIYEECHKNHAAKIGGFALDGCGGYIACPSFDPSNPSTFACVVCGCHRNFHRSEKDGSRARENYSIHRNDPHHLPPPPFTRGNALDSNSISPPFIPFFYYPPPPHIVQTLNNITTANNNRSEFQAGCSGTKKQQRTRFSGEQKVKMQEMAEKIGWKMQKNNEEMIEAFCVGISVQKNAFKIWMHNNKYTLGRRDIVGDEDTVSIQLEGNINIDPNENVANVLFSSSDSRMEDN